MKEIIAIIRSNKWQETKTRLMEAGVSSYTVQRVYGRGRQKGLKYQSKSGLDGISYLPKRMLTVFVDEKEVQGVVELIIKANRTGEIGDGKIFVSPLGEVQRVRTGEQGVAVLS